MKPLIYYAHSAQDKLGNLLPYKRWQTLQSHLVNVGGNGGGVCSGIWCTENCLTAHQSIMLLPEPKLQKTLALEWRPKYNLLLSHLD